MCGYRFRAGRIPAADTREVTSNLREREHHKLNDDHNYSKKKKKENWTEI